MSEVSIEEIYNLLKEREKQMGRMEATTKSSREKLKKINEDLKKQESILLNILSMIQQDEMELTEIDNVQTPNIDDIFPKIEKVQESLRKSRNSLANLIRKG